MQVTIVGLLTGKYQDESYNVMTVYDGTGTIEVREFRDGDADLVQVQPLFPFDMLYEHG